MLLATDIIPKDWDLRHDHHTSYDAPIDPTDHKLDHRHIHVNHNDHHHHHDGLQTGTGLEEKTSEHCSNEVHFLKFTRKKKKVEVGIRGEHRSSSKVCVDCHTSKTPLWRSGPSGPKSLCNACGIRYRKKRSGFDFVGLPKQARVLQKRFAGKEEAEAAVLLMALSWGASLHS